MTKQATGRASSRERILDAAAELVREIGAGRLTLDAVAERSGMSKGGLLYNYPSKDALLKAMVQRMVEEEVARKEELRRQYRDCRNLEARLGALAFLSLSNDLKAKIACGLLAALAENPDLLEPIRAVVADHWRSIKATSEDKDAASIAWLAVQGLRSLEMHDLSPITAAERGEIQAAIMRLLDAGGAARPGSERMEAEAAVE